MIDGGTIYHGASKHAPNTRIIRGSYSGNDSVNRAIPHGFDTNPIVFIKRDSSILGFVSSIKSGRLDFSASTSDVGHAVTATDATNFYVGNATSYGQSANEAGSTYSWTAIA